jgi:hypothetical protein
MDGLISMLAPPASTTTGSGAPAAPSTQQVVVGVLLPCPPRDTPEVVSF